VGTTVLLTFEVEARNSLEDFQPGLRVAANFDLRLERSKRVERLVEQVAPDAGLWLISSRTDVTD